MNSLSTHTATAVDAVGAAAHATARTHATHERAVDRTDPRGLRTFDVVLTLAFLPFAVLIGSLIALLIVLDSPGPIFYRASRVGKHGKTFQMLKFRKMRRCATGGPLTMADDDRFTPIGRFLALTKLDELPQLYNVLRGQMRLVGPRPEDMAFVTRYRAHYDEILSVVPGITGPAAVQYAGESRLLAHQADPLAYYEEHLMPLKIDIDIKYTRTRTVPGDVRILVATLLVPAARIVARLRSRDRTAAHRPSLLLAGGGTVLMVLFAICAGV